jgi:hypothetical protein
MIPRSLSLLNIFRHSVIEPIHSAHKPTKLRTVGEGNRVEHLTRVSISAGYGSPVVS